MYFTENEKTALLSALSTVIAEQQEQKTTFTNAYNKAPDENTKKELQEDIKRTEELINDCKNAAEKISADIRVREKNTTNNTQNPKEWLLLMPEFEETTRNICYFFKTLKHKCYTASIIMWILQEVCKKTDVDVNQFYHDLAHLAAKLEEKKMPNKEIDDRLHPLTQIANFVLILFAISVIVIMAIGIETFMKWLKPCFVVPWHYTLFCVFIIIVPILMFLWGIYTFKLWNFFLQTKKTAIQTKENKGKE